MKKTIIIFSILTVILTACSKKEDKDSKVTPEDISKDYNNEELGLSLTYPETFTVEEGKESVTVFHSKEQPVPYFVINFSEKKPDVLINELKDKAVSKESAEFNNTDAVKVAVFNDELGKNVDFFYVENKNKTLWFSCFDGLYNEICNSIKFED